MKSVVMLSWLTLVAFGQVIPTNSHPTNLDFSKGEVGQLPVGWRMPPAALEDGYRAQLQRQDCGWRFAACVAFLAPIRSGTVQAAELDQTFPAEPYVGRPIRFSAWLRVEGSAGDGYVHLRMRVDYPKGKVDFFDSAAPPVNDAEWQRREVFGRVSPDAVSITIWARYHPLGLAWVADPSFGIIEDSWWNKADDESVRALIRKFAELRNVHDGPGVAALYSERGEWFSPNGQVVGGRQALATLWGGVTGQVERTIESIDFAGQNVAIVRVTGKCPEPLGRHHETFLAVKENGTWYIRLHETLG